MSAMILNGKDLSVIIREQLKNEVEQMVKEGVRPGLAVVLVGDDPASKIYVNNKKKACEQVGIQSFQYFLEESTKEEVLLDLIVELNNDSSVHGILVQLPLPDHISEKKVIESIDPKKDVDCFHPMNTGKLFTGSPVFLPCTPAGCMELLKLTGVKPEGKECVVVGRSNIVGKPMAVLLLRENGTVTVAHSRTKNLKEVTKRADILVVAVGKAHFITEDMVKPGAVVLDVGMNRLDNGKLAGDVDFENVQHIATAITPVPGGVGPMTITMLLKNTVTAAKNQ
ncbi:MAG TPA: bifunctional methylenetetrahydrofolate dehydrogenase/methenyltetrahydrofolate cyclohydrolase FolD [Clostridiales bacterium]|nr:bifunctional methylenetetrahydrofolate dehydrogenase/methenyltetrahydrofolate cyclohydrolase FolD [Clostridiales bacterium]